MLDAGGYEDLVVGRDTPAGTVDLDLSCAGEHHVDLVERVRRLRVGGWREEDVDTKLEPRRLVDHLVAAPGGL